MAHSAAAAPQPPELFQCPIDRIVRGKNPRTICDEAKLDLLASTIRQQGVLEPIVVCPKGSDYEIVAGERRWLAAQRAGLRVVPTIVRASIDESERLMLALIENIQREDLRPLDTAKALQQYIDKTGSSINQLAKILGKSRGFVYSHLELLKLPNEVKGLMQEGQLAFAHARTLIRQSADDQIRWANRAAKDQIKPAELTRLVDKEHRRRHRKHLSIMELEKRLRKQYGCSVDVSHRDNHTGQVTFYYNSLDEIDRLVELFLPKQR